MSFVKSLASVSVLLGLVFSAAVVSGGEKSFAAVSDCKGKVEKETVKDKETSWVELKNGDALDKGDVIRTAKGSSCVLNYGGAKKTQNIDEESVSKVGYWVKKGDKKTYSSVWVNTVWKKIEGIKPKEESKVETPASVAGVRGDDPTKKEKEGSKIYWAEDEEDPEISKEDIEKIIGDLKSVINKKPGEKSSAEAQLLIGEILIQLENNKDAEKEFKGILENESYKDFEEVNKKAKEYLKKLEAQNK